MYLITIISTRLKWGKWYMIRVMDNDTHKRIQWWEDKGGVQGSYTLLYDYGSILVYIRVDN